MINKLFFINILTFITIVSNCQCNQNCKSEDEYYCILRTVFFSEKPVDSIKIVLLEEILPNTKTEFTKFYSYYCDTITKLRFELIDKRIGNLAYRNVQRFLELYINMAEFIDASTVNQAYLENYYYDLDFIIEKNQKAFCVKYNSLPGERKKNLLDFFEMYCE